MKKRLMLVAILVQSVLTPPGFAGGREAGNGGDGIAIEFVDSARSYLDFVEAPPSIDLKLLNYIVAHAAVESTDDPLIDKDGVERDALNFPDEMRIQVNRERWRSLSSFQQSALTVHEYLELAGYDDSRYVFSRLLSSGAYVQSCTEDGDVIRTPAMPTIEELLLINH